MLFHLADRQPRVYAHGRDHGRMTPPLAIALATRLFANRYTAEERARRRHRHPGPGLHHRGRNSLRGARPVAHDPVADGGLGVTGAISMAIGAELKVPHGGIFVLPIPGAVTHLLGYVAALIAGTLVSALAIGLLKRPLAARTEIRAAQPQSPRAACLATRFLGKRAAMENLWSARFLQARRCRRKLGLLKSIRSQLGLGPAHDESRPANLKAPQHRGAGFHVLPGR